MSQHRSLVPNANGVPFSVPCAIYRGGTSRAVFFRLEDLPSEKAERSRFLLAAMGSPHVRQIDGLGGAHPATSKVAMIGASKVPGCDVDYTFAQVDILQARVDYSGLCGNVSASVGPFAIDSGLVKAAAGSSTVVTINNTNTEGILTAVVPTVDGKVDDAGSFRIDGVSGAGPKIFMDYRRTAGKFNGQLLPTGNVTDVLTLDNGSKVVITLCDLANPLVFVNAEDLGARGDEAPAAIEGNAALIATQREIRGRAAVMMGLAKTWQGADTESPVLPPLVLVSPPRAGKVLGGGEITQADGDLSARFIFMNRCHEAMAGTGSMCIAVASRIPGSVVNRVLKKGAEASNELRIIHPSGVMDVEVSMEGASLAIERVGIGRTSRLVMEGTLYLPNAYGRAAQAAGLN